ncbi:hypothetical protein LS74_009280 [Helicobacter magdeburgensis]|uniref:Uncharacterized protein n=1 Tax=Helicobacter magdeburgensis TaxID=471858 RepID=A0A4U8SWK7_9HELI|nr:hypothetical protein [Helicobacter magdeburgensis]TLD91293.1 hypothetical protein LS74_009280 [Helicobacter magdeburgensis]
MRSMAHYILNELSISEEIREKIEAIKNSYNSYQNFNDFRFLMQELESFRINEKMSENAIKANINNFIHRFIKKLNKILEESKEMEKEKEHNIESEDAIFFDIMAKLAIFKDRGTIGEEKSVLMTDIRMLLSKEIDTDKKEILKETLNILDSYDEEKNEKHINKMRNKQN